MTISSSSSFVTGLPVVDGICGSGQSGTVKNGGVENARVDKSARYGKGGVVDIAGMDNAAPYGRGGLCRSVKSARCGKGGHCRSGQCGTIVARVDNAGGNKKLSYCWETVRRESMPRIAEMDVEMTT